MRNKLRRLFTLLLALVVTLGTFGVVTPIQKVSAGSSTDSDGTYYYAQGSGGIPSEGYHYYYSGMGYVVTWVDSTTSVYDHKNNTYNSSAASNIKKASSSLSSVKDSNGKTRSVVYYVCSIGGNSGSLPSSTMRYGDVNIPCYKVKYESQEKAEKIVSDVYNDLFNENVNNYTLATAKEALGGFVFDPADLEKYGGSLVITPVYFRNTVYVDHIGYCNCPSTGGPVPVLNYGKGQGGNGCSVHSSGVYLHTSKKTTDRYIESAVTWSTNDAGKAVGTKKADFCLEIEQSIVDNKTLAYLGSIPKDKLISNYVGVYAPGMFGNKLSYDIKITQNNGINTKGTVRGFTTDNHIITTSVEAGTYSPSTTADTNYDRGYGHVYVKKNKVTEAYNHIYTEAQKVQYVVGSKKIDGVLVPVWGKKDSSGNMQYYSYNGSQYYWQHDLLKDMIDGLGSTSTQKSTSTSQSGVANEGLSQGASVGGDKWTNALALKSNFGDKAGVSISIERPSLEVHSYVVPIKVVVDDNGYVKSATVVDADVKDIKLTSDGVSGSYSWKRSGDYKDVYYITTLGDNRNKASQLINQISDDHSTDVFNTVSSWGTGIGMNSDADKYVQDNSAELKLGVQANNPLAGYTAFVVRIYKDSVPSDDPNEPAEPEPYYETSMVVLPDYALNQVTPSLMGTLTTQNSLISQNNEAGYGSYKIAAEITKASSTNKLYGVSGYISPMNSTGVAVSGSGNRTYINYAYELIRSSANDKRTLSGISYSTSSTSETYKFAKNFLGLGTGVKPSAVTKVSSTRNSDAVVKTFSNKIKFTTPTAGIEHPLMVVRRVTKANGTYGSATSRVVAYNQIVFKWTDTVNKYQTIPMETGKYHNNGNGGTSSQAGSVAQTNKINYRWAYIDTHKNSIVTNFYPEVRMYVQQHKADLTTIQSNSDVVWNTNGVLTMGEEKRSAEIGSLYITRIDYDGVDGKAVTGTVYSDTMAGGSEAGGVAGGKPVIYAGSDVTLDIDMNFTANVYGYAVDTINKSTDSTMYYVFNDDGTVNTNYAISYDKIVKSGTDLTSAWGNSNNTQKLFNDYKAFATAVLDPNNIGVDVQLSIPSLNKTYNNFSVDMASISATTPVTPVQAGTFPIEIRDGKVNENGVYYKAFITQLAKDYGCTEAQAKEIFKNSKLLESFYDAIESSNDTFNKSQAFNGEDHWYDEEVRTIVIRRYATEGVMFGGAILQDKIDYGAAPESSTYTSVDANWNVSLYFKNNITGKSANGVVEDLGRYSGFSIYDPYNINTLSNAVNTYNVFIRSYNISGAEFKIPSETTQNMGD